MRFRNNRAFSRAEAFFFAAQHPGAGSYTAAATKKKMLHVAHHEQANYRSDFSELKIPDRIKQDGLDCLAVEIPQFIFAARGCVH